VAHYADPKEQLVVEVLVRDIACSKRFYERFGFETLREESTFLVLAWEGCRLFLDEKQDLPPGTEVPRANVRLLVPDVDRHWQTALESGASVVSPIADRSYGLRDFTILDPDGFGLRFASWLPGFGPR